MEQQPSVSYEQLYQIIGMQQTDALIYQSRIASLERVVTELRSQLQVIENKDQKPVDKQA